MSWELYAILGVGFKILHNTEPKGWFKNASLVIGIAWTLIALIIMTLQHFYK